MLKWTASAQKLLLQDTPSARTPQTLAARRRLRRATIANKENIPYTSTPLVARERSSPLVLAPLTDIRNVTPESGRRPSAANRLATAPPNRRHSTVGFSIAGAAPQYASTLPRFAEEYSPSTALPSGQQLALRGLLPDPFVGNPRYFATPEMAQRQCAALRKTLPHKRQLEQEFVQIAQECASGKTAPVASNVTALSSTRMGDRTLDKLIDAILDSARKDPKKKKPRRSFNLRRRTLLKNQPENVDALILSPSYTAADDPASDLSFLLVDAKPAPHSHTSQMPPTPAPATPPPGTPIPEAVLQRLPTPRPTLHFLRSAARLDNTFKLETPVRPADQKRRPQRSAEADADGHVAAAASGSKRYRVDGRSYFEIGLALPSIYV